jgi:uncharacterized membrane protein YsdA (DUF1294 family)
MTGFYIALLAAITMLFTDVSGTLMVIGESRGRGWFSGLMDTFQWLVGIVTTTISVTALQGHALSEKIWVVTLVSAANLFGTWLGVYVGRKFVKDKTLDQRLKILEDTILVQQNN